MNNKFFTTGKGLTSTKASFTADSIKNLLLPIEARINGISFYTTSTALLSTADNKAITHRGVTDLDGVEDNLELQGAVYGLSAWLREAIKQKEQEMERIREYSIAEWAKDHNIVLPVVPSRPIVATEAEIMFSWEPAKIARYYTLEAKSAHYKYINPDGSLYKAYKDLQKILSNPCETDGKGQDTIILSHEPSVNPGKITALIEHLRQNKGSYENELNSMKSELKKAVDQLNLEREHAYQAARQEYQSKYAEVDSQFNAWQIEETARISALKIIIPENLQFAMTWLKTQQQEIAEE